MPVPAPKPWRRPPPEPMPVDLDDEATALDLIDRIRGLRLNGAENFEVWLQERADAEYSAALLVANAGLTDDTRAELEREATLLRRQANPPAGGARVWTRSDERISTASEVDDPKLAEAKAYDLIDRMRSLRLNGAAAGKDLHRERSYLLSQSSLLLTTASLRPATRSSLSNELALLEDLSDEVVPAIAEPASEPAPELSQPEPVPVATPEPEPEPAKPATEPEMAEPETELAKPEPEPEPEPEMAEPEQIPPEPKVGFWRRLRRRLSGAPVSDSN